MNNSVNSDLISVIIVNYNAGHYLAECVKSVFNSSARVEIFVVDNASSDQSIASLEQDFSPESLLTIIKNPTNLGFSKANNLAIPKTQGNYLLFLNPDCLVNPDALARMRIIMEENSNAGMAGCLIRNSNGTVQDTCIRNMPTPWNSLVRVLHLNKLFPKSPIFQGLDLAQGSLPNKVTAVPGISGAFMFVRREALEQVGTLDENYFLYCEDTDWMLRFSQKNWQILFVPDVAVTHAKGISSRQIPFRVLWYKHAGMLRFNKKFYAKKYPFIFMWGIYLAILVRLGLLTLITILKTMFKGKQLWQKSN